MATERHIPFMKYRKIAAIFSVVLVLASIASLAVRGLNLGLDFTGGTLVELGYEESANLESIRNVLGANGYDNAVVVNFGTDKDVLIRLQESNQSDLGDSVLALLQQATDSNIQLRRVEFVGPQVGEELRDQGGLAILVALFFIMAYVAVRFQYKFSLGAVVALIHDVIITLGAFSLFQWEFDLTVLAALLAVIGYSLNDTIVVADRIRENFKRFASVDVEKTIDLSLNQMLGRTLMTSITTLLVLVALFIFGGEMINGFSKALIVGVGIGTYSSIYIAANILMKLNITKEDMMPPEVEGVYEDGMP